MFNIGFGWVGSGVLTSVTGWVGWQKRTHGQVWQGCNQQFISGAVFFPFLSFLLFCCLSFFISHLLPLHCHKAALLNLTSSLRSTVSWAWSRAEPQLQIYAFSSVFRAGGSHLVTAPESENWSKRVFPGFSMTFKKILTQKTPASYGLVVWRHHFHDANVSSELICQRLSQQHQYNADTAVRTQNVSVDDIVDTDAKMHCIVGPYIVILYMMFHLNPGDYNDDV